MSDAPGGGGYMPLRCITSGRLTPAAATLINTSPVARLSASGRVAGLQHFGLARLGDFDCRHGVGKSRHVAASFIASSIAPLTRSRHTGNGSGMRLDEEDLVPRTQNSRRRKIWRRCRSPSSTPISASLRKRSRASAPTSRPSARSAAAPKPCSNGNNGEIACRYAVKTALVTGSTSGIGLGIAHALAARRLRHHAQRFRRRGARSTS